jgi:uncharacterized protein YbjT (DUF2867 family)
MRLLVTGSAGHLGEALIRTLRDSGHEVVGLDILDSPYTTEVGSITDRPLVRRCMAGVQAVFHAATLHKSHVATHFRREFVDVNVTRTLKYIISATTPFLLEDLPELRVDAPAGGAAQRTGIRGRIRAPGLDDVPEHRARLHQSAGPGGAGLAAALRFPVHPRSPGRGRGPAEPARASDRFEGVSCRRPWGWPIPRREMPVRVCPRNSRVINVSSSG